MLSAPDPNALPLDGAASGGCAGSKTHATGRVASVESEGEESPLGAMALHGGKAAQDAVAALVLEAHAVAAYGPQALVDFAAAKLHYYEGEGDEGGADKQKED